MSSKVTLTFLLFVVSAVYLFTASGRAVLDDGDALYATVALQMVERGDWITPVVNGVRFLDKPPMMYWLMALSYLTIGRSEFAARLPSVLAVIGTSCLLYLIVSGSAGRIAGLSAGLALSLCVGTYLFTLMVFPDMLLVFFLTLAIFSFWRWYRDPRRPVFPALVFYVGGTERLLRNDRSDRSETPRPDQCDQHERHLAADDYHGPESPEPRLAVSCQQR